jgi:hypothetical protein
MRKFLKNSNSSIQNGFADMYDANYMLNHTYDNFEEGDKVRFFIWMGTKYYEAKVTKCYYIDKLELSNVKEIDEKEFGSCWY